MPFDPNLPQPGTEIDADQMRGQLNGLKDLIDAIQSIAAAQIDAVNTLDPGEPAAVTLTVTGNTIHFTFGIPRGQDGAEGPPGEVSQQDLDDAINGTSNNSDQVSTLGMVVEDPPTQNDVQVIADKVDELLLALRRN